MTPAEERASHPEGAAFQTIFARLLIEGTKSCFERTVLCDCKDQLWEAWKIRAIEDDLRRSAAMPNKEGDRISKSEKKRLASIELKLGHCRCGCSWVTGVGGPTSCPECGEAGAE